MHHWCHYKDYLCILRHPGADEGGQTIGEPDPPLNHGRQSLNYFDDGHAKLVGDGLALAYRQFSSDYVEAEAKAEAARAGLWSGTFDYPWNWRKAN